MYQNMMDTIIIVTNSKSSVTYFFHLLTPVKLLLQRDIKCLIFFKNTRKMSKVKKVQRHMIQKGLKRHDTRGIWPQYKYKKDANITTLSCRSLRNMMRNVVSLILNYIQGINFVYYIKCIKSFKTFLSNDIHVKYCSVVIEAELTVYQIPTKTCQGTNLYLKL